MNHEELVRFLKVSLKCSNWTCMHKVHVEHITYYKWENDHWGFEVEINARNKRRLTVTSDIFKCYMQFCNVPPEVCPRVGPRRCSLSNLAR
jgi:hypothetical protein